MVSSPASRDTLVTTTPTGARAQFRRDLAIRSPQEGTYTKTNPLRSFNPIYNVQGSLSGPLLKDKLTFFVTGRYFSNDGYLYGKRWFTPQGLKGDGELVSMNPFAKFSGQGKLAYRLNGI